VEEPGAGSGTERVEAFAEAGAQADRVSWPEARRRTVAPVLACLSINIREPRRTRVFDPQRCCAKKTIAPTNINAISATRKGRRIRLPAFGWRSGKG
jgi:hypothetical protein